MVNVDENCKSNVSAIVLRNIPFSSVVESLSADPNLCASCCLRSLDPMCALKSSRIVVPVVKVICWCSSAAVVGFLMSVWDGKCAVTNVMMWFLQVICPRQQLSNTASKCVSLIASVLAMSRATPLDVDVFPVSPEQWHLKCSVFASPDGKSMA